MTLANGRTYLAIPGPSVIPDRVLQAMHRASPNIYEGELIRTTQSIKRDLARLAGTAGEVALYIGNGHGAWEASLSNILSPGDKILVANAGDFAQRWGDIGASFGAEVINIDFGLRAPIDPDRIETELRKDTDHRIRAVMAVQVDTASGVLNDIGAIRAAIDRANHPALLLSDNMASMGCEPFKMDRLGVDMTLAGSQKGLMTPAGIAILWLGPKALEARETAKCVTPYWDWKPRIDPQKFADIFFGTAPTHQIFGLREALDMIDEEGLDAILVRHETLARAIWAAVDCWGQGGPMELNITDPKYRSHSVTTVRVGAPHGTRIRRWVETNMGVTLGIGLGMGTPEDPSADGVFRIGHMGHVNAPMVLGVLGAIDAALKALGIPHGKGAVEAATTLLAGVVAKTAP